MERLAASDDLVVSDSVDDPTEEADEDTELPAAVRRMPLAAQRRGAVLAALAAAGAVRVLDLGCGPGALLAELLNDHRFTEIVGVDVSARALEMAARRLRLDRLGALGDRQRQRIRLLQSALTYRDARLSGYDAAVLMELIEHVDEARLGVVGSAMAAGVKPGSTVKPPETKRTLVWTNIVNGGVVKAVYIAEATATGGREGRVRSSDGALTVDLAIPKELGGPGGVASNPEQLFAAGYAACFENAFRLAARRKKVRAGDTSVTARVGIGPDGAGGFGLSVELHVRASDLDSAQTEEVATDAERVCPYSNAVRGNIDVNVIIDQQPEVV